MPEEIKIVKAPMPYSYNLRNKLHTEVLEETHAKIDVQVLFDDDNIREVLLANEEQIANTYAITMKHKEWHESKEMCAVNAAIQNGEAIGRAFKSRGFIIQKNVLDVFTIAIPSWLQAAFDTNASTAKARIMEFVVKKQSINYNYGIITEIYSPAFRKPEVNAADEMQVNIPSDSLMKLGFTKEEVWAFLENKTIAPHLAKLYSAVAIEIKARVRAIMYETLPLLAVC